MNVIANANDQANNLKQLSQQSLLWRHTNFCKKPKSLPTPGLSVASENKVREGGKKPQLIYRTRSSLRIVLTAAPQQQEEPGLSDPPASTRHF